MVLEAMVSSSLRYRSSGASAGASASAGSGSGSGSSVSGQEQNSSSTLGFSFSPTMAPMLSPNLYLAKHSNTFWSVGSSSSWCCDPGSSVGSDSLGTQKTTIGDAACTRSLHAASLSVAPGSPSVVGVAPGL